MQQPESLSVTKGCKGYKKKAFSPTDFLSQKVLACSLKNYQCMKEEIKLIVFLAQKSRHVEACRRKQGSISPSERDHMWMGAIRKDALLILYIMSITQVTTT